MFLHLVLKRKRTKNTRVSEKEKKMSYDFEKLIEKANLDFSDVIFVPTNDILNDLFPDNFNGKSPYELVDVPVFREILMNHISLPSDFQVLRYHGVITSVDGVRVLDSIILNNHPVHIIRGMLMTSEQRKELFEYTEGKSPAEEKQTKGRTFLYGQYIPKGYTLFYPVDSSFENIEREFGINITAAQQYGKVLNMFKLISISRNPNLFEGNSGTYSNLEGRSFEVNFEKSMVDGIEILSDEVVDDVRYIGLGSLLAGHEEIEQLMDLIEEEAPDIGKEDLSCVRHRCREFYKASKLKLLKLREKDFFTWLSIHSYMMSPIINVILFEANGDWTKFDQTFSNVVESRIRIKKYSDSKDPYNIFNTWYKGLLIEGAAAGKYLKDRSGKHQVVTYEELVTYYPEMKPYLTLKNKAKFTFLYAQALQNAILSIPRLLNTLQTYRGYSPLNIPGTLTLDVDNYEIGQEITTWGFMSISLNKDVSAMFADAKQGCCMLKIILPPETPAFLIQSDPSDPSFPKSLAPFDDEEELLLPVGIVLKIVRKPGQKEYVTRDGKSVFLKTAYAVVTGRKDPIVSMEQYASIPNL